MTKAPENEARLAETEERLGGGETQRDAVNCMWMKSFD
jgi:hypothetical protein